VSEFVQAGVASVMVVGIVDPNDPALESRLADHVARHPGYFANAAVVLDLAACQSLATVDGFDRLKALFRRQYLILAGIRNGNATQIRAAANAGLATFAVAPEAAPVPDAAPAAMIQAAPALPAQRTRVITQPVRSGTQVYVQGGDLIVLAPVSAGAEVLADGNVHIYGALRGRAIAGAAGDTEARIFVAKLEAELLSVAGHYMISEAIGPEFRGAAVQVALVEGQLVLTKT
jgi:septum site-determining protein MinC